MMYNSIQIANFFIKKGIKERSPVSPLKLQMLLYYAYGWYIVYSEKEEFLFDEKVEAWKNGPFTPSIYNILRPLNNNLITEPIIIGNTVFLDASNASDKDTIDFLDMIWELYGQYSDIELANSSHNENGPWFKTMTQYRFADGKYEIPFDLFFEYFSKFIKKTETSEETVSV